MIRLLLIPALLLLVGCGDSALDKARRLRNEKKPIEALRRYEEAIKAHPEQAAEITQEADALVAELLPEAQQRYQKGDYEGVIELTAPMLSVRTTQPGAYLYNGMAGVMARPLDHQVMSRALSGLNKYLRLAGNLQEQMTYPRYLLQALGRIVTAVSGPDRKRAEAAVTEFGKDVVSPFTTTQDIGFVMRHLLYRKVALAAVGAAKGPEAQARALFDWLVRSYPLERKGAKDLEAIPYDVLARGFGSADRLAWTYVDLARQLDLSAVVRLDPIEGSKQFAISVLVVTAGKTLCLDPRRGIERPAATSAGTILLITGEKRSYYPRMRILEDLLRQHAGRLAPRMFCRPDAMVALLAKKVQGHELPIAERAKLVFPVRRKDRPTVDLWGQPFRVDALYRTAKFRELLGKERARYISYRVGRLLELQGEYRRAFEAYQQGPEPKSVAGAQLDCSFLSAVCLQAQGKPGEAAAAYRRHLAEYPKTPWRSLLQLRLGECLKQTGKATEAAAAWKLVSGPRKALAAKLAE